MEKKLPKKTGGKLSRDLYCKRHDDLVAQVIIAMSASRLCKCWPQPTGAAYRDGKLVRYGLRGSADITGILIDGRRLEVEIKTGNAKQMAHQETFQKVIMQMGGIYFVARSVEDALLQLQAAANNSRL